MRAVPAPSGDRRAPEGVEEEWSGRAIAEVLAQSLGGRVEVGSGDHTGSAGTVFSFALPAGRP